MKWASLIILKARFSFTFTLLLNLPYSEVQVSQPQLVQEITTMDRPPSEAAEVPGSYNYNDEDNFSSITWMLDDQRSSTVMWYCRTLVFPVAEGKHATTLGAFQHFSYLESNKWIVFVDLQST